MNTAMMMTLTLSVAFPSERVLWHVRDAFERHFPDAGHVTAQVYDDDFIQVQVDGVMYEWEPDGDGTMTFSASGDTEPVNLPARDFVVKLINEGS